VRVGERKSSEKGSDEGEGRREKGRRGEVAESFGSTSVPLARRNNKL
jgi:hypothetical protein